jgi:hypothetical protein
MNVLLTQLKYIVINKNLFASFGYWIVVTASASAYPSNSLLISLVQSSLDEVAPYILSYHI